jgi:hypothetical protein
MNVYRYTRLNRPLLWSERSNRVAMIGTVLAGTLAIGRGLIGGGGFHIADAIHVGGSAFIGWAIAREIDPDHPGTATVAMVLATLLAFGPWRSSLLIAGIALLGLRVLAGTVGGRLKPLDLVVLVGAASFCGTRISGWVVVLLLVIAVLDAQPDGYGIATMAMLIGAFIAGFVTEVGRPTSQMSDAVLLWGLIAAVGIVLSIRPTRIRSRTDIYDHPIIWPKVRAARVMAGFAVIGGLIASDSDTLVLLVPVVAALIGTALVRTFRPA